MVRCLILLCALSTVLLPTTAFSGVWDSLKEIVEDGSNELYLTGYAWHNRYTYSPERIRKYNEAALGGGFGKGLYTESGNWHGLYAMAFLDSHSKWEPIAGYSYLYILPVTNQLRLGGGITAFITARSDIFNGIPFPGILPWASIIYKKVALSATYIPGSSGAGNVLFLVGKLTF